MPRLFQYVVARDYGFAPNPFGRYCTLATCKPKIRSKAQVSDLVIGTGSKTRDMQGRIVFFMRVSETMAFDEYWLDDRFRYKRPSINGSIKSSFGDNIYHHDDNGDWLQENSHHSHSDGTINIRNVIHDTSSDRVLVAEDFSYFGKKGLLLPTHFEDGTEADWLIARGHKSNFSPEIVIALDAWRDSLDCKGFCGDPIEWGR